MLSIPTDFEGRRCLMALRMSETETDAKYNESGDWEAVQESRR
jgi:hypothetical protein